MMTPSEMGCWALVGTEPAGRFLLERWRVRADFPFVAVCNLETQTDEALRYSGLPNMADWNQLLADPELTGMVLAVPREQRAGLIRAAISAGKRVLVEGSLGSSEGEDLSWQESLPTTSGLLGVFQVRRPDLDFLAARAAVASGRLGTLHTVRWISCDYALSAGQQGQMSSADWADVLQQSGPFLLDQLQQLTSTNACRVAAWSLPRTSGFQVRLEYHGGLSAWIDLQRSSLCGLETGWVLEGSAGAYRNRRLWTLATDGEILEEDLPSEPEEDRDVMADLRELAQSPATAHASCHRSLQNTAVLRAILESIEAAHSISVRE